MQAGGREGVVEERMKAETRMQEGWMTSVEEMKMIEAEVRMVGRKNRVLVTAAEL